LGLKEITVKKKGYFGEKGAGGTEEKSLVTWGRIERKDSGGRKGLRKQTKVWIKIQKLPGRDGKKSLPEGWRGRGGEKVKRRRK